MTHGGRHAPYLAIFTLGEFEANPSVGYRLTNANRWDAGRYRGRGLKQARAAGARRFTVQLNSSGRESREDLRRWAAFDLDPIFAAMAVARIEQFGI